MDEVIRPTYIIDLGLDENTLQLNILFLRLSYHITLQQILTLQKFASSFRHRHLVGASPQHCVSSSIVCRNGHLPIDETKVVCAMENVDWQFYMGTESISLE